MDQNQRQPLPVQDNPSVSRPAHVFWLFTEWLPPTRRRLLVAFAVLVVYTIVFAALSRVAGPSIAALSLVPPILVGSLLGMRVGFITGVFTDIVTLVLLVSFYGVSLSGLRFADLFNYGFVILAGIIAGLVSERSTSGKWLARQLEQEKQMLRVQIQERERAEALLRQQNIYFTALHDTAFALVGRLNLNELLEAILTRAGALVGTENGYVFLLDPETNEMVMRVGVGAYQEFIGTKAVAGVALAGTVWQTGEAVAVDDYRNWSGRLADPTRNVLRAVVGVPLKRGGEASGDSSREQVIGVLGLAHLEPDKRFNADEMDVLSRFAALAAIALDNAQLYESAQRELAQRRAADSKLAYERDLLQALMDNIPDLIFFKDRESRFVRSNAAHLKNLGAVSMDDVFGKTDLDFHGDASAHHFMDDEKTIIETGASILNQVESNPTVDGTLRYFSTSKVPWRNQEGEIIGTLGVAHDITDRVLAEQKLEAEVAERKRAEQFLDSIIENLPTMLFVKDARDLSFVHWNKAAESIAGISRQELLGKNDYDFFPKEDADFFVARDREALANTQVLDILEEPLKTASGETRWLHTKKFPVMDANGAPAYLVGISEDITERKRAEQEFRESREFLETLVSNIPLGIFVKDARNLRIVQWNKANEAITGISAADVLGKTDYELFPREQADFFVAKDRETLERASLLDISDEPILTPNRGLRYLHTKKIPLHDASGKPAFLLGISEDITERKRAEDVLRANEYMLSKAEEIAHIGSWRWDKVTGHVEWSEQLYRILGMERNRPPLPIFELVKEIVHPQDRERVLPLLESLERDQLPVPMEFRVIGGDGATRYLFAESEYTFNEEAEAVGMIGVIQDLSERRRAEEQMRESERRFRSLADNVPSVVYICNNDERFTMLYLNNQVENLTGIPKEEFLSNRMSFADLYHPDDVPTLYAEFERALAAHEPYQLHYRFKHTSGEWRWIEEIGTGVYDQDGTLLYLEGLFFDISDRLRAEQQLRESEQRYRDLFENANDLIQSVSADGHFGYVNRSWKETLGYSEQEITTLTFMDIVHPDERQHCSELFVRMMQGESLPIMETAFVTRDGRKVIVEGSTTPRIDNGQVVSTRGIFRDVTARRLAEERATFQNALLSAQHDVSPDGILVVGADDQVLSYNRRFIEIWNVPHGALEARNAEPLRQAVAANLLDVEGWFRRSAEIYLNRYESSHDEVEFRDGRTLERYSAPMRAPDGRYLGRVWFFHDITDIRRSEQDIRRIMQGTRAIFWRAVVTKLDKPTAEGSEYRWETNVSNVDAALQAIPLRLEPGQSFEEALHSSTLEQDRAQKDSNSSTALRNGAPGYTQEYRVVDENGVMHWMYEDARIRSLGGGRYEVVGVSTNITERKRAEEALRANQALYQSLVETMPQALTRKDRDGRVTFGNTRFFEDTGKGPAELYGKTDFDFHPYELAEKYRQDDLRVLQDGETIDTIELHERGDGTRITVHVIKTPIRNPEGEIDGMQIMFWDITEEQKQQELIRQQNAYLNALQETSLGLMQRLDVASLLHDIVARAGALVGTENGYVFLRDADFDEMEMRVGVGAYEGFVGRRTRHGVGLAGQVWEKNMPIAVDDYRTFGGRLQDASRDILRAVVGVPLRSGNEVIGVIGLAYLDDTRKFGEAEIQVLQRFAQLATIALDNARLHETAQMELAERARAEAALAQQLRDTEFVNRVTSHAVSLDVDKALVEICRDLAEYFEVEKSAVALLNEDKKSLTVVADHAPPDARSIIGYVIPVEGNLSTQIVLETRQTVAFSDAQNDPRLAAVRDLMVARGTVSVMIAPLFVRDEIIGTLGIDSSVQREFTPADISLVQRVAFSISTALENARLYRAAQQELNERRRAEQQIRQRNRELEVISRVSAVMTTDIDMHTALETLARELVQTFNARNCGIALLDPAKTSLTVVADALSEEHEQHAVGIVIPLEGNLSSQYVIENKRSLVIPDAQTDPMTAPIHERMRQRRTKCLAIVPLLSGGEVIGTIGLDTTDPNHLFSDEEIRLAETMANQMANAIEKQRLFDQTKARARREQLTREIGANLTRSLDLEQILQTTARQLSHALGASHAVVRMGNIKDEEGGNGHS